MTGKKIKFNIRQLRKKFQASMEPNDQNHFGFFCTGPIQKLTKLYIIPSEEVQQIAFEFDQKNKPQNFCNV